VIRPKVTAARPGKLFSELEQRILCVSGILGVLFGNKLFFMRYFLCCSVAHTSSFSLFSFISHYLLTVWLMYGEFEEKAKGC